MKHIGHFLILLLLIGSIFSITPTRAAPNEIVSYLNAPDPQLPEDAQSTTGPIPAPGILSSELQAPEAQVLISGVPAYLWRHGCGPTAAGMVLGYWDGHGFDALVSGSAATQTSAVDQMIASTGNYNDYCLPIDEYPNMKLDKSEPPYGDEHANNSIADFMDTSQSDSQNYYGWSWYSDMAPALQNYVEYIAPQYSATVSNQVWGTFTWTKFRSEIDAGRPVVLLVDTDANGSTDHFITAIGYSDSGGVNKYACLNTWDTGIHWYNFAQIAYGRSWGIYGATLFDIEGPPPPAAFTKTSPPNLITDQSININLRWKKSTGATSYDYCYDKTAGSTCEGTWTNTTSNNIPLAGLDLASTYYWQVRGRSSTGVTEANSGTWWSFSIAATIPTRYLYLPLVLK